MADFFINSIKSQLTWAQEHLQNSPSPLIDAEVLLAFILNKNRAYLYSWPEKILSPSELINYQNLIKQRSQGTPIAYLINSREFWSLDLITNPNVLIPRPETELLVEAVLKYLGSNPPLCPVGHIGPPLHGLNQNQVRTTTTIADFGTGSGAIAIALSCERPDWKIFALDSSKQALSIAEQNIQKHGCSNITLIHSHWGKNLHTPHSLDAIVSNPPYLAQNDPHLALGDLRFEPKSALVSGESGLEDFEQIIQDAKLLLKPQGFLFFEHGYQQAESIYQLLIKNNFSFITTLKDINNHDRVSVGQLVV